MGAGGDAGIRVDRPHNGMAFTTRYSWGDVLLVSLPTTDMAGIFKRPALALYDEGDKDVMVARITSHVPRSQADALIQDWRAVGLQVQSIVRLGKVATISKSLVDKMLGKLTDNDSQHIKQTWLSLF